MKKSISSVLLAIFMVVLWAGITANTSVYAEEEVATGAKTSLTITPANRTLQLTPNMNDDGVLSVTNDGDNDITVEVYATPYSYTYSEEDDEYKLGYSHENSFTQISRWIKIKSSDGVYETKATFKIKPGETEDVSYRITTPEELPAGGQYAVIFAQVKSDDSAGGSIKADPSLGMIVYGRSSEGDAAATAEIRDMQISKGYKDEGEDDKQSIVFGSAKVKNTGNVDFFAQGILKVVPIIGFSSYETSTERGLVSIIPEAELSVTDEWTDLPSFGIYKVTWTVIAGNSTETVEQVIFLFSPISIILMLLVLTLIVIGVIMMVKRRKTKKSRLAI